jgi:tRNA-dihydrouridine synthase
MIGRGALRDPFLVEELKTGTHMSTIEKIDRFKIYYSDLQDSLFHLKSEQSALPKLKELWKYFAHFLMLSDQELLGLLRINDIQEFKRLAETILSQKYKV